MLPTVNQDELVRQQFFQGFTPDNQMEAGRIDLETPISGLRDKAHQLVGLTQPIYQAPVTTSPGITFAEIEKLNSKMVSLQEQIPQPAQIRPPQTSQKNEALEHLYILAQR
ncbi:2174_t:CDS:1 [Paraglomus brasilianum]|uniref:2174_t:CDS:1 n=1 Tax=Paraglomus brasilianum TaxID=144538 RepID=A0A9N9FD67_9GLOM|nr:2174_t:CDS:1 [Paraglomus brasilianum]